MDLEILERKKNDLIKREEIRFIIRHPKEPTPKRDDVRKKLAAIIGKDEKLVILRKVISVFGKAESVGRAHVYEKEEDVFKWEPKYILKRNGLLGE